MNTRRKAIDDERAIMDAEKNNIARLKNLIREWLDSDNKELPWIPFTPIDYQELIKPKKEIEDERRL